MFLRAHKTHFVIVCLIAIFYIGAFFVLTSSATVFTPKIEYPQTASQSLNNAVSVQQLSIGKRDESAAPVATTILTNTLTTTTLTTTTLTTTTLTTTTLTTTTPTTTTTSINLIPNASFDSDLTEWSISRCTLDPEIVGLPEATCIFSSGPLRRSAASKVTVSTADSDEKLGATDTETVDQYAQLETENGSIRLRSSLLPVEPSTLVRFSVQMKADEILDSGGWHKGGISLSTHGQGGKKIRHYDFASFSGSFDWKQMNGELFIPEEVQFVRLNLEMRQTSGRLLVDDAVLYTIPLPDFESIEQSVADSIEPQPNNADSAQQDNPFNNSLDNPLDTPLPVVTSLKPALPLRGAIVAGSWFNSTEIIERFKEARFNFAWSQGSFLNQKMQYLWREPLHENEKRQVREWISNCNAASLRCYLSLSPRGRSAESGTVYSATKNVDLVMKRFETLYGLGVRHFGLSFDDLQRFEQADLLPADAAEFDHIGEAHAHFVGEIYDQLTAKYDDINLMLVPLYYDLAGNLGSHEEAYLYALGQLPLEVGMISSTVFIEDAETAIRTTGRRHVIWDNQFAFAYENGGAGEYIAPLQRPVLDESLIAGYAFLPLMKSREDKALVSWQSASDYAWEPAKYDPDRSLQRAVTNYLVSSAHTKEDNQP